MTIYSIKNLSKNKLLLSVSQKYSDTYIKNYFFNFFNSKTQVSSKYHKDPNAQKIMINEIVNKHILMRDALYDPISANNTRILESHHFYFWDPKDFLNSELRGPQAHLSRQMFIEFGFAGNDIELTKLSGIYLGSLFKVKNTESVSYPIALHSASPFSFGQGFEVAGARMISSYFDQHVIVTNDDPNNIINTPIMHRSFPWSNTNADYQLYQKLQNQQIPVSTNLADNKIITLDKAKTIPITTPQISYIGTVDASEHCNAVRNMAKKAIHSMNSNPIAVEHIDPSKNTFSDVLSELKNLRKTGKTADGRNLTKFHHLFSNEENS